MYDGLNRLYLYIVYLTILYAQYGQPYCYYVKVPGKLGSHTRTELKHLSLLNKIKT